MRIDRTFSEARQSELASRIRDTAVRTESGDTPVGGIEPVARIDRVEISDAGRALAARNAWASEQGELSAARIDELRRRVRDGAYNDPAVADALARRLLGEGEI